MTAVDPVAAARYFVQVLGCTAFPVWGSRDGRCMCGDPHDGTRKHGPDNVGKHPATPNGFKDATDDLDKIKRFLSNAGTPNYGLNAPHGVMVIDVDGPEGLAEWESLQHRYGPLPVTLTTTTANGRHYFYRWPEGHGPMPTGKLFGFVVRRHDDGYVIGPGSVHPKGVVYDTLRQPSGMPYDIAELTPAWAVAAIKAPRATITVGGTADPSAVTVGSRHDWLRDTARLYAGTVRDPDALKAAVMAENAKLPVPKSEADVDRAIGDVLKRFGPDPVDPDTGEVIRGQGDDGDMLTDEVVFPFPDAPGRVAYGGLMGEMVEGILEGTDASEVALLASLLSLCGALVPARAYFGRMQMTAPHIALVGESSIGRKGTAMIRAQDALGEVLGGDVVNRILLDGINSGEGLVTALEYKQTQYKREPTAGVLFEEEFATLLSAAGRDGSSLDSRLRQAFDGGPLSNRKASGTQTVEPPYWLSALVGITPSELQEKGPSGALQSGSANRWLWLPVIRREVDVVNTAPVLPPQARKALWAAYEAAREDPATLDHSEDVSRLLTAYGKHLVKDATGLSKDLSRRYPVIAFRIAMIHAALERSRDITAEYIHRGIALTEYARRGVPWVFGFTVGNELATLILRHLREVGSLTRSQITRDWARDPIKRQRALDELRRLGFAEVVKLPTGNGRNRAELRLSAGRGADFHSFPDLPSIPTLPDVHVERTEGMEIRETTEEMENVERTARNRPKGGARVCPVCHQQHPAGTTCDSGEAA